MLGPMPGPAGRCAPCCNGVGRCQPAAICAVLGAVCGCRFSPRHGQTATHLSCPATCTAAPPAARQTAVGALLQPCSCDAPTGLTPLQLTKEQLSATAEGGSLRAAVTAENRWAMQCIVVHLGHVERWAGQASRREAAGVAWQMHAWASAGRGLMKRPSARKLPSCPHKYAPPPSACAATKSCWSTTRRRQWWPKLGCVPSYPRAAGTGRAAAAAAKAVAAREQAGRVRGCDHVPACTVTVIAQSCIERISNVVLHSTL